MSDVPTKSLDWKLNDIHSDPSGSKEFVIADAKDADMAFGIGAPGVSPERHDGELRFKTLAEYREQIRQVIRQGLVDIVLMSTSTSEQLTLREGLFDGSHVTPAIRANDTTDVHVFRGSRIGEAPAKPFRTTQLDHAQCGHLDCEPEERARGANLGLYSVTFNNDCELDLETLEQYNRFREEAERKGFRHFLEVFNPNLSKAVSDEQRPDFINDVIARTLAGVASAGRPVFLKIAYQGPKAMEQLVAYDPHLVVGVLGGAAGTTLDAFQLLYEAKKYGARAALFGRKINQAECQLAFIEFLRHIADGLLEPREAVRAYHSVLEKLEIRPHRSLEDDLVLQATQTSYGESQEEPSRPSPKKPKPVQSEAADATTPNFSRMSSEEKADYFRKRLGHVADG
ncbi:beta/alpha barrel domain-containing protein [Thalassoroseus pseudoceratinae]|uniref:hypothetical protein n=1 Tax=Thalassoroseus pseudoceratinae TaxID=2713176 RepID=UPI00142183EE|nr:hypothetical protein [Thalassoroseus pseudoceratinae]